MVIYDGYHMDTTKSVLEKYLGEKKEEIDDNSITTPENQDNTEPKFLQSPEK